MLKAVLLFSVGLAMLIVGGDWFVDGATGIARIFRIPELLIGATIVSLGTTLPEVMVSASSALSGHGEIAYGNAIGSIICNAALILAVTVAVKPAPVNKEAWIIPIRFFAVATVVYVIAAYYHGRFSRLTGLILVSLLVIYLTVEILEVMRDRRKNVKEILADVPVRRPNESLPERVDSSGKKEQIAAAVGNGEAGSSSPAETGSGAAAPSEDHGKGEFRELDAAKLRAIHEQMRQERIPVYLVKLAIGAAAIATGANLLVDNGTLIAQAMGVPESVIALTFVALGTSLPELVTAITSLIKGHGALSVGNIIGANLLNLTFVTGVSALLNPFDVPAEKMLFGRNASLVLDIPLMIFVMLFVTVPAMITGEMKRYQGIVLLILYFAFCMVQFFL